MCGKLVRSATGNGDIYVMLDMGSIRSIIWCCLGTGLITLLSACGGGSGGQSAEPTSSLQPSAPATSGSSTGTAPTTSEQGLSRTDRVSAAQFLQLATFGATATEIDAKTKVSVDEWLEAQFQLPISRHTPIVNRYLQTYGYDIDAMPNPGTFRRFAFWERVIESPDQLRQLVAYALTQVFVVSDRPTPIFVNPLALSSYYDTLLEHSFGNFEDLLLAVTMHPVMGFYLSHVNNAKSDPVANTFPDENYAREVMQLFTIGLYELNLDGSWILDPAGKPIPTYDNQVIREFSKVFTGLSYGETGYSPELMFGKRNPAFNVPMVMFEEFHEPGEKTLLNGEILPSGQSAMEDIRGAVKNLFQHANVGPFIGKLLIQRLITSNPSPAYVARVASAFNGGSETPRGDMKALVRAILTDPEAASAERIREPFRRYVHMIRALEPTSEDGSYPGLGYLAQFLTGQHVLSAPSVFNFYSPAFTQPGELETLGWVSPELQITTEDTIVGITNLVAATLYREQGLDTPNDFPDVTFDLSHYVALADEGEALVDEVAIVFAGDQLSDVARSIILDAVEEIPATNRQDRVNLALYLTLIAPSYAVLGDDA